MAFCNYKVKTIASHYIYHMTYYTFERFVSISIMMVIEYDHYVATNIIMGFVTSYTVAWINTFPVAIIMGAYTRFVSICDRI